jgi:hypothetical protein
MQLTCCEKLQILGIQEFAKFVELSCSFNQACYRCLEKGLELPFARKSFNYVCMFFCCFLLALHYVSSSSNVIMSVVNSNLLIWL